MTNKRSLSITATVLGKAIGALLFGFFFAGFCAGDAVGQLAARSRSTLNGPTHW